MSEVNKDKKYQVQDTKPFVKKATTTEKPQIHTIVNLFINKVKEKHS